MRLILLVLAVTTVGQIVWRLWLVRNVTALTVLDEDGYLVAARVLGGGPGGGTSENTLFRRVGYPLIISPAYWFSHDPLTTYRSVLVWGAVLNSLTVAPAYLFARRVMSMAPWLSVALAVAVTASPAVAFYSQVAMPDAILPMLVLWWLLAVHAMVQAASPRALGLLAGLSSVAAAMVWLVHVRGLVVVMVQVVLIALIVRRHRSWRPALTAAAGAGLVFGLELAVRLVLAGKVVTYGGDPSSTLSERLTSPAGWLHILAWSVGQVWYTSVATLGLATVGMVATVALWRRRSPVTRARDLTLGALLATTIGIALMSSATLPDDQRINLYAYGRYLAFLAPAWIAVGVAALGAWAGAAPERALRAGGSAVGRVIRLAVPAAVVIVVAGAAVLAYSQRLTKDAYIAFDAPEVGALTGVWDGLPVVAVSLIAIGALAVLSAALATRARVAAVAALIVLGVVALPIMADHATRPMAAESAAHTKLVDVGVTPADNVAVAWGVPWRVGFNHQWEVWWQPVVRFQERDVPPPAQANVVVAPYDVDGVPTWDGTPLGFRLVYHDPQGWAVWRR